jgi:hypothetical protein
MAASEAARLRRGAAGVGVAGAAKLRPEDPDRSSDWQGAVGGGVTGVAKAPTVPPSGLEQPGYGGPSLSSRATRLQQLLPPGGSSHRQGTREKGSWVGHRRGGVGGSIWRGNDAICEADALAKPRERKGLLNGEPDWVQPFYSTCWIRLFVVFFIFLPMKN